MVLATRSGVPTTYAGTNFRSRLEARWASFFDLVGWRWTYEPFDTGGWIPDFLIQGHDPFLVEVGPCITEDDYRAKSAKAQQAANGGRLKEREVLVLGSVIAPDLTLYDGQMAAGLLGQAFPACEPNQCTTFLPDCDHAAGLWFEAAVWATGSAGLGVYHTAGSYGHRPNGDGHERALPFSRRYDLDEIWRKAGNAVQWKR